MEIDSKQAFINGSLESGADLNDPETQEVLTACQQALECLHSNLQYSKNNEVYLEIK